MSSESIPSLPLSETEILDRTLNTIEIHTTKDTDITGNPSKKERKVVLIKINEKIDEFVSNPVNASQVSKTDDSEDKYLIEPHEAPAFITEDQMKEIMKKIPPPKKICYNDVKEIVRTTFFSEDDYNSTAFDIIATYIKGQKIIYTEAMSVCVNRLNYIMLPTILLSAIATVLSLSIAEFIWGPTILASLNAFNGFLLAVVNYSKLDAASEAHKITSHQYDKLQSLCEFTSGRLMILSTSKIDKDPNINSGAIIIRKTIDEIEAKIKDIKETNSFIIPSIVRSRFMNIYYLNIFSVVKKIRDREALLINTLKNKLNKVRKMEYLNKIGLMKNDDYLSQEIIYLNDEITEINEQIISVKTKFTIIEKMFKQEIRNAEKMKRRGWFISSCCFTTNEIDTDELITRDTPHSPPYKDNTVNLRTLMEEIEETNISPKTNQVSPEK